VRFRQPGVPIGTGGRHFFQGEAKLTLGDDRHEAKPGTWVHMPTGLRHSIQAKTLVVMLLLLLKQT
jgi:quercetin dioxygenase-like cupin family protein